MNRVKMMSRVTLTDDHSIENKTTQEDDKELVKKQIYRISAPNFSNWIIALVFVHH